MPQISKATERNWRRRGAASDGRLTARANKTLSAKRIEAAGYLDSDKARELLRRALAVDAPRGAIMRSLVEDLLASKGMRGRPHAEALLREHSGMGRAAVDVPPGTWDSGEDILGYIYQSLTTEGERNASGLYYTSRRLAERVTDGISLQPGSALLDPCCGSGAFLLAARTDDPTILYGLDTDPVAVMLASANLMVKHRDKEFRPNVFRADFLKEDLFGAAPAGALPARFSHICTNPPWGADRTGRYAGLYPRVRTRERASLFICEALRRLDTAGDLRFLLPLSLLTTNAHGDIRRHLLEHACVKRLELFDGRFDGVFTGYFALTASPGRAERQEYDVTGAAWSGRVSLPAEDREAGHIALREPDSWERAIVAKMEAMRHDDLTRSLWALGIVTGDNKERLNATREPGMEPVCKGRQVTPFRLLEGDSYIRFQPGDFQQCAEESLYRAPEKLVYRFIAKHPVVAYDNRQLLCLNSANVLIPKLDGISVKSTAALLNSALYRYYYSLRFTDVKVLKGNLEKLPFPRLSPAQDKELSALADLLSRPDAEAGQRRALDRAVYAVFGITAAEQARIEANVT